MKVNKITSSFIYDNKKIILAPKDMTCLSEKIYIKKFSGGLEAILEYHEPASGAFTCLLRFKNTGTENTKQIKAPKTLDMAIAKTSQPILWHSLSGDSCGEKSFMPLTKTIACGECHHVEPFGGRSSNTSGFPYFDICYSDTCERSLIAAIGWTGQWSQDIASEETSFTIQIGLCHADFYLKPGEEVRCPSVFFMFGEDVSQLRRDFRRLHREQFSPKDRLGDAMSLPCAIQPFDRYFQGLGGSQIDPTWATEYGQIRTLNEAAKCQYFDTFWLDAAWFRSGFPTGVGNYQFAEGFPNGLKKVSDAVHAKGMKMMLWFEPERIYEGSEVNSDHRDMLLFSKNDKHNRLFNLGDGKAREWLTKTLISMIEDNGIDIYRQDFNMEPLPFWQEADEKSRCGITEMKYVAGLYALWDSLIERFPKIFIDNCSSGGRRIDFETCKRAVPLWRSDTGCFPESQEQRTSVWNNNQILSLTEYLPYQAAGVWSTAPYDIRAAATNGIACNFDVLNPDFDFEAAKKVLGEMQRLKKYWEGDFYPLTEAAADETVWCAYQLSVNDSGIAYFFRREHSNIRCQQFKIQAIHPNSNYTVSLTDESMHTIVYTTSGSQLSHGIEITIPNPRNSLILEYIEE